MGNKNENNKKSHSSLDSYKRFILNDVDNFKKLDTDRQTQITKIEKYEKKGKKKRRSLFICPCFHLTKDDINSYKICLVNIIFLFNE